ncbi:MAG: hypothetical protein ABIU95_08580, partial [Burkholderiales bacterium]
EGNPASVYLDRAYNDALGPMHEDAVAASEPLALAGIDPSRLDVRVLAPVDLAISKLGRFGEHDRDDIAALARAGLLDARAFEPRAKAAIAHYVGHPAAPQANLRDALVLIRANTPTQGVTGRGVGVKPRRSRARSTIKFAAKE